MSTGTKQPRAQGQQIAQEFLRLFEGTYDHWYFAGSLRRGRPEVGDIEHVILPKFVPVLGESMFGPSGIENAVWQRAEALVRDKTVTKAVYGETKALRWGEKYRGIMFSGIKHELFMADVNNLGSILTIRTGPAEFSERCVTLMKQGGNYRQEKGYVRRVIAGDVSLLTEHIIPVPTEAAFLKLCGLPDIDPTRRDEWMSVVGNKR